MSEDYMDDVYRLKAELKTRKHVHRVFELMSLFAAELLDRGAFHDRSKFDEEELGLLAKLEKDIAERGDAPFGSDLYKERSENLLDPMIKHHYQMNPHHPQHHKRGLNGMNLFDVVEMFADWKAASERYEGHDKSLKLKQVFEQHGIEGSLREILINTAFALDWVSKDSLD